LDGQTLQGLGHSIGGGGPHALHQTDLSLPNPIALWRFLRVCVQQNSTILWFSLEIEAVGVQYLSLQQAGHSLKSNMRVEWDINGFSI